MVINGVQVLLQVCWKALTSSDGSPSLLAAPLLCSLTFDYWCWSVQIGIQACKKQYKVICTSCSLSCCRLFEITKCEIVMFVLSVHHLCTIYPQYYLSPSTKCEIVMFVLYVHHLFMYYFQVCHKTQHEDKNLASKCTLFASHQTSTAYCQCLDV